jgi:hypothetical protein
MEDATVAVAVRRAPSGRFEAVLATTVSVAEPKGMLVATQETVPGDPTAGVVHVKPEGAFTDWKTSPPGSGCVRTAFVAGQGPAFVRLWE